MTPAPIIGTCTQCGCDLVSGYKWKYMTDAERASHTERGQRAKAAEGLCRRCRESIRREAEKRLVPVTSQYSRAEMLAEWAEFVDHSQTLRANCFRIGPRLGMRPHALEKALNRAGIHAWPIDSLGWAERGHDDEWAS